MPPSLPPGTTRGQCGFRFNTPEVSHQSVVVEGGGLRGGRRGRRKFVSKALRPYIMLPWVLSAPAGTVVTVTLHVAGLCLCGRAGRR